MLPFTERNASPPSDLRGWWDDRKNLELNGRLGESLLLASSAPTLTNPDPIRIRKFLGSCGGLGGIFLEFQIYVKLEGCQEKNLASPARLVEVSLNDTLLQLPSICAPSTLYHKTRGIASVLA